LIINIFWPVYRIEICDIISLQRPDGGTGAQTGKERISMVNLAHDEYITEDVKRRLDALTDDEREVLESLMEVTDYSLEEALGYVERGEYEYYSGVESMADLAYRLVHDCEWGDPDVLENLSRFIYVDYEKLGAELYAQGWRLTTHGAIW